MTDIPSKSSLTAGSVTQGQFKTALDQLIDALRERLENGATPIQADAIDEATPGAGILLDGVLLKDGGVALAAGKTMAPDDGGTGLEAVLTTGDYGRNLQVNVAGDAFELTGPAHGFRNRLVNGDFAIWQRGTGFSGANRYAADRWYVGTANAPTSIDTSRQAFTPGQTAVPGEPEYFLRIDHADNNALLYQRVEDVRTFAGGKATYSFYARADAAVTMTLSVVQNFGAGGSAEVGVAAPSLSITTSWQRFEVEVTFPGLDGKTIGAGSHIAFRHSTTGDHMVDYACMQLEDGSTATPFEKRPLATELAMCQRYYLELAKSGSAWAVASTDIVTSVLFPTTMRAAPAVTLIDSTPVFNDYNINLTSSGVTAFSTLAVTAKGAQLRMDGFTGAVISRPGFWNQTTPIWAFDAEL